MKFLTYLLEGILLAIPLTGFLWLVFPIVYRFVKFIRIKDLRYVVPVIIVLLVAGYLLKYPPAPPWEPKTLTLKAQQPQYGGIISNHPVTTKQSLGLELTWLGLRATGVTDVLVRYQVSCDNGNNSTTPVAGSFIAVDSQTNTATFGFSGTAQFFPCNGWLNWASMLVYAPNTITPGELMAQLEIHNAMPIGWNVAAPAANGATTTATVQSILTGTIEEVLYSCSIVSGYVTSWPSAVGCSGNPRAYDPGSIQNLAVSNPAAATNWQAGGAYPYNGNENIQIVNVSYTVTTSATAGTRGFACLIFMTGGVSGTVVGGPFCSTYQQAVSQTVTYNFAAAIGGLTNCSLLGATQTAVQCASVPVPLPQFWEANGAVDNFAIGSCFTLGNVAITNGNSVGCSNGFVTGDQISAINIRARIWHAND